MNRKAPTHYSSLDDIKRQKEELQQLLQHDSKQIERLWNGVFVKRENASKADYISSIVSNGIFAVDAFMLFRKLQKNYKGLKRLFKKK